MSQVPWRSATALLLLWTALPQCAFSDVLQSARVSCNAAYNAPCARITSRELATGTAIQLLALKNVSDDFLQGVTNGDFNNNAGFYPFVVDRNTTVCVAHGANSSFVGKELKTIFSQFGIQFSNASAFHTRFWKQQGKEVSGFATYGAIPALRKAS